MGIQIKIGRAISTVWHVYTTSDSVPVLKKGVGACKSTGSSTKKRTATTVVHCPKKVAFCHKTKNITNGKGGVMVSVTINLLNSVYLN